MYSYNEIRIVHLEITDKCNASCPMCARNKNGGSINQHLPLTELSLNDIKKIFPIAFIKQLERMFMCGNYGDPIIAKDTLKIFKHFRSINPNMMLSMNTNGSARNDQWWKELGGIIGKNGDVKFGIDGLADTHSIYRKDTDFNKILRNAKTFIKGGGNAIWEFIVFGHNEHQIAVAETLSKVHNFSKFTVKKTGRFFSNVKMQKKNFREVYGKNDELLYKIYPPKDPILQNKSLQEDQQLIDKYGSMEAYLNETSITCKVAKEKSVFVSADGYIFPCCWTANQMYVWYMPYQDTEIWKIIKEIGGIDTINAKNYTIKEIVEGSFFEKIEKSWTLNSIKCGKLKTCAKTCGQNFDQFKDQYE